MAEEIANYPPVREAIADRHERLCGPQYGQAIHCCPDPICREAYKSMGGWS